MAQLNKDTTIGGIEVYPFLTSKSGGGVQTLIDVTSGDLIDLIIVANEKADGVNIVTSTLDETTFSDIQKSAQANTCVIYFKAGTYDAGKKHPTGPTGYDKMYVMGDGITSILKGPGSTYNNAAGDWYNNFTAKEVIYKNLKFDGFLPSGNIYSTVIKSVTFDNIINLEVSCKLTHAYLQELIVKNCNNINGYPVFPMDNEEGNINAGYVEISNCVLDATKTGLRIGDPNMSAVGDVLIQNCQFNNYGNSLQVDGIIINCVSREMIIKNNTFNIYKRAYPISIFQKMNESTHDPNFCYTIQNNKIIIPKGTAGQLNGIFELPKEVMENKSFIINNYIDYESDSGTPGVFDFTAAGTQDKNPPSSTIIQYNVIQNEAALLHTPG